MHNLSDYAELDDSLLTRVVCRRLNREKADFPKESLHVCCEDFMKEVAEP